MKKSTNSESKLNNIKNENCSPNQLSGCKTCSTKTYNLNEEKEKRMEQEYQRKTDNTVQFNYDQTVFKIIIFIYFACRRFVHHAQLISFMVNAKLSVDV